MTCTKPWLYRYEGHVIELPCGRCMACRISKSREWSIRCEHEMYEHKDNTFITLTYDEEHLPENGTLVKEHVQKFIKRLRFRIKQKIKVFYSGEYGDDSFRPHYHILVFGWCPPLSDLYLFAIKEKRKLYSSKILDQLWKYGANNVGVVMPESISYVTRYTIKKLYGDLAEQTYGDRVHPFMHCSKGIGLAYAQKNSEKIEENLGVIMRGKNVGLPSYYFKKLNISKQERHEKTVARIKNRNRRHYSNKDAVQMRDLELQDREQREANLLARERNRK